MARKIKVDNALQKRFSRKQGVRKKARSLVAYFLIVCEGEKTEPNYFRSFPKQIGKVIYDVKFEGGGISTLKVVEKAIELRDQSRQKYDSVWAVFDKDSFKPSAFNSAIAKANAKGIKCAWSNEAFGLWYLLHFEYRDTAMSRNAYKADIEQAVNRNLNKGKANFKYLKNDTKMYALLEAIGSQELAIKSAKKLTEKYARDDFASQNPHTLVYKLVEELTGRSEEFNKEIFKYEEGE